MPLAHRILTLCICAGLSLLVYSLYPRPEPLPSGPQVLLAGKMFSVEVADTESTRATGLSGHVSLSDTEGMLFIFETEGNWGFWMKDMTFSIDIVWLDSDFKVVHIEKSVSPETYPKIFSPNVSSRYVLEILSGVSDTINLKLGDTGKFVR